MHADVRAPRWVCNPPDPAPLVQTTLLASLVALAAVTAASGCPREPGKMQSLPALTTDDPEAEADLKKARQAADADRTDKARRLYAQFLEQHPDDPLVPRAKLGLGRVLLAEGEIQRARELLSEVAGHEDPSVAERARFYQGVALHLAGDHEQAVETLEPFVGRTVDPEDTALLLRTLAAASLHTGDRVGAVEAFDHLMRGSVPEDAKKQSRKRIEQIIQNEATTEEIQTLYDGLPHEGPAWRMVARRAARQSFDAGKMGRVRDIIDALRKAEVELGPELQKLAMRAERSGQADTAKIGAILPLSGRGREAGQLALRGLMLAANTPPKGPMGEDAPQILFRDDGGDPERAVQAVNDLVSLHQVIAIIGPVDSKSARKAAKRAQELGVPLITLSPAEEITEVGPMVFRQFVTPDAEARALVRAARSEGAQRFAVMHPDNGYGRTMRKAYTRAIQSGDGQLIRALAYPADTTSFGEHVRKIQRERFDALLVADGPQKVAMIAPALAAAGLWSEPGEDSDRRRRAITLLLPNVAYGPALVAEAGRYVEGALVTQPLHTPSATGPAREFVQQFRDRYGSKPDTFAAYAYDAFQLVREAVQRGASSRHEVSDTLPGLQMDTVGPSQGFRSNREPVRGPRVLQIRDGQLTGTQVSNK